MSLLSDIISGESPTVGDRPDSTAPVLAGTSAAAQAAVTTMVLVLVPAVAAWATASGTGADWIDTVRVAADAWLLAHHTGMAVTGGHVGLAPLALTGLAVGACWYSARRLARALDPRGAAIRDGVSRATPATPPARALVAFTVVYAAVVTLVSLLCAAPAARPVWWQALLGGVAVAAVGALWGAASYRAGGTARAGLAVLVERLPGAWGVRLRAGVWAAGLHLGAATVLVVVASVLGVDRVLLLHRALDPGIAGGVVLSLLQLAYLPNAVAWAASYLAGPGFAMGTATSVTVTHSQLGALPAVPALGALPLPGAQPSWLVALIAVPVLAGAVAGALIARSDPAPSGRAAAMDAVGAGVVAGLLMGGLAWLSGGPVGPGHLAVTGPVAWQAALATALEVGFGAGVGIAAFRHLRRNRAL